MSANFEAKKVVVEEIKEKIQNSKSVVFVKFSGLTVAEDTELRREFRKNNVEYKVLKNTLIRKAFNDLGVTDFDEDLNGPTSVAFGEDETGASKVVIEAAKKYQDKVVVKSAYFEEKRLDEKGVKALAAIPSKQQLYAMLASALLGVPRALAIALNQVAEKNA
jgi:large subunit ribosomal protein L10